MFRVLSLICVLICFHFGSSSQDTSRIVGGSDADIANYPYLAQFEKDGIYYCSGAIINREWIVTAGSCYETAEVTVRLATGIRSSGGFVSHYNLFIVHKDYDPNTKVNDIALFKTDKSMVLGGLKKSIPIAAASPGVGEPGIVLGWGHASSSATYATRLQIASVAIADHDQCAEKYSSLGGIADNTICTTNTTVAYPCAGEVGSPLIVNCKLVGVASWSRGCNYPGYPYVYTDITKYLEFIKVRTGISPS